MTEARDDTVADNLNDLYQDHENRDGHEHHWSVETLVPVTHGEITQPTASDHTRHGGITHQGDSGNNDGGENA